jgi:hypothetical protein
MQKNGYMKQRITKTRNNRFFTTLLLRALFLAIHVDGCSLLMLAVSESVFYRNPMHVFILRSTLGF